MHKGSHMSKNMNREYERRMFEKILNDNEHKLQHIEIKNSINLKFTMPQVNAPFPKLNIFPDEKESKKTEIKSQTPIKEQEKYQIRHIVGMDKFDYFFDDIEIGACLDVMVDIKNGEYAIFFVNKHLNLDLMKLSKFYCGEDGLYFDKINKYKAYDIVKICIDRISAEKYNFSIQYSSIQYSSSSYTSTWFFSNVKDVMILNYIDFFHKGNHKNLSGRGFIKSNPYKV